MALNNLEIDELAEKMDIPLVFCNFKNKLEDESLEYNHFYIVNLEDEYDEVTGLKNSGSHYTCFQVNKYKNDSVEAVYLDPYGVEPPTDVINFIGFTPAYNKKQIQGSLNNACGWFCLAYGHFINSYPNRTKDLYTDSLNFTELFEDLAESNHHLKNEWILKHFFRSNDPNKRRPIEVEGLDQNNISGENFAHKIIIDK